MRYAKSHLENKLYNLVCKKLGMKGNDPFLVAENEKFQRMKLTRYYEKWCLNFIMMIHILHKLSVMFLHDWDNG